MATYKEGQTVIVTQDGVNRVGVILDRYLINKQTVYDVLLERRSALIMLNTAPSKNTYINKSLTAKLCDTEMIETTIPYKEMLANEDLPICHA
jgi:hypothetical protein